MHLIILYFVGCQLITTVQLRQFDHNFMNLIPENYDMSQPPVREHNGGFEPIVIHLNPLTIASLSPKNMEFKMDMFVSAEWHDPRYNYNVLQTLAHDGLFKFPKQLLSMTWMPSVFFENCKDCADMLLFDPQSIVYTYYDASQNKTMAWVRRLITFNCRFYLKNYPFDSQTCTMRIFTYGVEYQAYSFGIWYRFDPSRLTIPAEFKFVSFTTNPCINDLAPMASKCFEYHITVQRSTARFFLTSFLPSFTIVIISWMSFWIDPSVVAARISLGLTSLLTLVTQFTATYRELPADPTPMALDEWSTCCIVMVFLSLMEFWLVTYSLHKPHIYPHTPPWVKKFKEKFFQTATARRVDSVAQIIFPVTFAIFNIWYWSYYSYDVFSNII